MAEQVNDSKKYTSVRLPTCVIPIHYDVCLKPDFDKFTFEGKVKIDYKCPVDSIPDSIVLHSNELRINDGALQTGDSTRVLTTVTYSDETNTATLEFEDGIAPTGTLCLFFTGIINDKMVGLYRTSFELDGTKVYAATTQFAATDARRCFPCWDEPAIKATFSATLIIGKFLTINGKKYERLALSNMPEISRTGSDEELEVRFAKTPIMSTYLLAFSVGPFGVIEGTDSRRPIRVFTALGKQEQGRFALEVACKSLTYFEDYFNVPYPLPKMDLIAIPDFAYGAMENWGLVSFRELRLLIDDKNTSTDAKQTIASIIAHELAHQWFGNLVTMEWWTHLWLNEGFATFMQFLCVDHIFPAYDIWSQFVTDALGVALDLDSLHTSHPIEVVVNNSAEVNEIFDIISYKKGASVIRMLYNYIGDNCFRTGMKDYLTKFAYKNAATEDLWDCLEAASNKPVRKLMSGWTSQMGYPWLSVTSRLGENNQTTLSITQSKFTADGKLSKEEASINWTVPVSAISGKSPSTVIDVCLFDDKSKEVVLDDVEGDWLKLNPGTIGLYRTAYSEEMAAKLWPAISNQTLPPMDRLGLQSDFLALCQAGHVKTVDLLKLLQAFKGETNYTVWQSVDTCLRRLNVIFSSTDLKEKFHAFGRELYSEIFKKVTWSAASNEKHTDKMTRTLVINRLIMFGDKNVIEEALRRYRAHLTGAECIPADLRGAVYRAVASYGDEVAYESLFTLYKTVDLHEEKIRIVTGIASTCLAGRLRQVTEFAMSDDLRNQDKMFAIMPIGATNPHEAWEFLKENAYRLRELLASGNLLNHVFKSCTENLTSQENAQEVEKFFVEHKFVETERSIQQSLEKIRLNANWLARDYENVKGLLS